MFQKGIVYGLFIYVDRIIKGVLSFNVQESVSPTTPVFGNDGFVLRCDITVTPPEVMQGISLRRKRATDSDFTEIVTLPAPAFNLNYTLYDQTLASRTIITQPDTSASTSASVTFTDTRCSDIAQYKWIVTYYFSTVQPPFERISDVKIQVESSFTGSPDFGLTSSSGYDVQEGTNVTFTCKANVGAEPVGQLLWFYFIGSQQRDISSQSVKGQLVPYQECSYTQVSSLQLTMKYDLNGVIVRCTLQQNGVTITDDHRQTNSFNVSYSTRQTIIVAIPRHDVYIEGESQVTLTCTAIANPAPIYTWLLPDGSEAVGRTYTLGNLKINDTGNYTCTAKNGIPNQTHKDSYTYKLTVVERPTTMSTTTTTTLQTTVASKEPSSERESDKTVGTVAGCLSAVIVVLIGVIVYLIVRQQNCLRIKGNPTYEIPDRSRQIPQDRDYDELQQTSHAYEAPTQRDLGTYVNTEWSSNVST